MDPIKDAIEAAKARLTTPILGTYIFFVALLNWPVWVYFFTGDQKAPDRVLEISAFLTSKRFYWNFGEALALLIFYVYATPWILELMEYFRRKIVLKRTLSEIEFKSKLRDQEAIGGSSEVLATCLKRDLTTLSGQASALIKVLRDPGVNINFNSALLNQQFTAAKNGTEQSSTQALKALAELKDVLNNNYSLDTFQHAERFNRLRKRQRGT